MADTVEQESDGFFIVTSGGMSDINTGKRMFDKHVARVTCRKNDHAFFELFDGYYSIFGHERQSFFFHSS